MGRVWAATILIFEMSLFGAEDLQATVESTEDAAHAATVLESELSDRWIHALQLM